MTIFDNVFPLGIGTNRFPIKGPDDTEGLEYSANLIVSALEAGASYIDVGYSYSRGMAETVCKLAFQSTNAPRNVTVKSSFLTDCNADDALRRVDTSFLNMGIDHASYFVIWNISSYGQFKEIMRKGSLYDGAVRAKERGLIDHICFSSHAPANDIVKILKSGAFEGATISLSVLNSRVMQPVLDCAAENDIGIVVMNPLGGGIVTQNNEYFSFLKHPSEASLAQAALRFVYAYPAVKVVLSGISSTNEVMENICAFKSDNPETDDERITRIGKSVRQLEGFCTGCRYCDGCPAGIPIHALMQSNNSTLFGATPAYNRTEPELLKSIQLFRKLYLDFKVLPENAANPCIKCGKCEKKCTQGLQIIKTVDAIYADAQRRCFSQNGHRERLAQLLYGKGYKLVGFYPGAGYSYGVLKLYKDFFGEPDFKVVFFDSNPKLWGSENDGVHVYSPKDISKLHPDVLVVSNYIYQDEIYNSIKNHQADGIPVVKLHEPSDVPWIF